MQKDKCPLCGKGKSRIADTCRSCYLEHRHGREKKGKHIKCKQCGKEFYIYPHELKQGRSLCSQSCYYEWQKGKPKPKPENFSETMRKVNPPKGRKIKKGGKGGYVWIYRPNHPNARQAPPDYGYVQEHVMVMADYLGRMIQPGECIHHLNRKPSDNRIENLVLCPEPKDHNAIHRAMEHFVEDLIKEGRVEYDRETKRFRLKEGFCIRRN